MEDKQAISRNEENEPSCHIWWEHLAQQPPGYPSSLAALQIQRLWGDREGVPSSKPPNVSWVHMHVPNSFEIFDFD